MIIKGLPLEANKKILLDWVRQSHGMIRLANEMLETTDSPEFWEQVVEAEQEHIKEIRFLLGELKRG